MTMFIVPARNDLPWYRFKLSLSGVIFTLRFRFNPRMQRYVLDVADASNNDVLNGLVLLIQRDLTGQFVISGLPTGTLFVTDDTGKDSQPTRLSFGNDHTFFYADPT